MTHEIRRVRIATTTVLSDAFPDLLNVDMILVNGVTHHATWGGRAVPVVQMAEVGSRRVRGVRVAWGPWPACRDALEREPDPAALLLGTSGRPSDAESAQLLDSGILYFDLKANPAIYVVETGHAGATCIERVQEDGAVVTQDRDDASEDLPESEEE